MVKMIQKQQNSFYHFLFYHFISTLQGSISYGGSLTPPMFYTNVLKLSALQLPRPGRFCAIFIFHLAFRPNQINRFYNQPHTPWLYSSRSSKWGHSTKLLLPYSLSKTYCHRTHGNFFSRKCFFLQHLHT